MKTLLFTGVIAFSLFLSRNILPEEIIYDAPNAKTVSVGADWNEWCGTANGGDLNLSLGLMYKGKDGKWHYDLTDVEPGWHEYKFIVDGVWQSGDNQHIYIEESEKAREFDKIIYKGKGKHVQIAGDWTGWQKKDLRLEGGKWVYPSSMVPEGKHEYKFIVDGNWEGGNNKVMYINSAGKLYIPLERIRSALIDDYNVITAVLKKGVSASELSKIKFSLNNGISIKKVYFKDKDLENRLKGYVIKNNIVKFIFDPVLYSIRASKDSKIVIGGNFSGWGNALNDPTWRMIYSSKLKVWELEKPIADTVEFGKISQFKFVVNGSWLSPPLEAPNTKDDGYGNINLILSADDEDKYQILKIETGTIDPSMDNYLTLKLPNIEPYKKPLSPGDIFKKYYSDAELGVIIKENSTTFRIFAPRASRIELNIYDSNFAKKPLYTYSLIKDKTGVWEYTANMDLTKKFYMYKIDGPKTDGETFDFNTEVADPYARAMVQHDGRGIILPRNYFDDTFKEWTDQDFKTPKPENLVIYEASIRDLTSSPSSLVGVRNRRKFLGLAETLGKGTGIDHLLNMGINAIEFLPIHEFDDDWRNNAYHWGYMTAGYFAPEASYCSDPLQVKQVTEFKSLVNTLHKNGIAIIMDVVYNHTGSPGIFFKVDKKYYYRLRPDFTCVNNSGCGNDIKTENPMVRKLIIDSLKYFVEDYHIDGFRFDLAALIDLKTLNSINDELKKIKKDIILIAEPWAMGVPDIKGKISKDDRWSYWNDNFRNLAKAYAHNKANRDDIRIIIEGTTQWWAKNPVKSVNYVESHDDYTLTDELSERPDHNGRISSKIDKSRNKICAALELLSLGIPMLSEGQDFMRSKKGVKNSYNAGDEINTVDWSYIKKYKNVNNYYKALIKLRMSDNGACFRYTKKPDPNYFEWFYSKDSNGIGYLINANGKGGKRKFIVLYNTEKDKNALFTPAFRSEKEDYWRLIGDENSIDMSGKGKLIKAGKRKNISLPPLSVYIYMNGFKNK